MKRLSGPSGSDAAEAAGVRWVGSGLMTVERFLALLTEPGRDARTDLEIDNAFYALLINEACFTVAQSDVILEAFGPPPARPTALYRFWDAEGCLLYVGISYDPVARARQHANAQPWWGEVVRRTDEWLDCRDLALKAERIAIEIERPRYNIIHAAI